uniref:Uncharacterized protein n=1 Tax=Panagrolaimus sp. ES5 TaxID=591445 RepID=A0AC34F983_9BILA
MAAENSNVASETAAAASDGQPEVAGQKMFLRSKVNPEFQIEIGPSVINCYMEVPDIQKYLNIVDDYTPEERKAMEEHPLEFFTGVSIQQDEAEQAAVTAPADSQ